MVLVTLVFVLNIYKSKDRHRRMPMNSRPSWSTKGTLDKPRLLKKDRQTDRQEKAKQQSTQCVCLCVECFVCMPGTLRGKKRLSNPLELDLRVVSSHVGTRNQTQVLWKNSFPANTTILKFNLKEIKGLASVAHILKLERYREDLSWP